MPPRNRMTTQLRLASAIVALIISSSASAERKPEIQFLHGSELMQWCKEEAQAHFAGKEVSTYQWSGRHYERGNILHVEGQIRAGDKDVPVNCRVAKGAREHLAAIEILEGR